MKYMTAEQCSDGWYVKITETRLCASKHDVIALARHEGLRHDATSKNEVFIKEEQPEQYIGDEEIKDIEYCPCGRPVTGDYGICSSPLCK